LHTDILPLAAQQEGGQVLGGTKNDSARVRVDDLAELAASPCDNDVSPKMLAGVSLGATIGVSTVVPARWFARAHSCLLVESGVDEKHRHELRHISGVTVLQTEEAGTDFPRLQVREGERSLVRFARFPEANAHLLRSNRLPRWADVQWELAHYFARPTAEPEMLPTSRSVQQ